MVSQQRHPTLIYIKTQISPDTANYHCLLILPQHTSRARALTSPIETEAGYRALNTNRIGIDPAQPKVKLHHRD